MALERKTDPVSGVGEHPITGAISRVVAKNRMAKAVQKDVRWPITHREVSGKPCEAA